jgi:hypothetical protein
MNKYFSDLPTDARQNPIVVLDAIDAVLLLNSAFAFGRSNYPFPFLTPYTRDFTYPVPGVSTI